MYYWEKGIDIMIWFNDILYGRKICSDWIKDQFRERPFSVIDEWPNDSREVNLIVVKASLEIIRNS